VPPPPRLYRFIRYGAGLGRDSCGTCDHRSTGCGRGRRRMATPGADGVMAASVLPIGSKTPMGYDSPTTSPP
jgi:hypothetical protein